MSEHSQATINYRCPICFSREVDVVLHRMANDQYYCTKCSFAGSKTDIREMYRELRKKYRFAQVRLTLKDIEQL